MSQPKRLEVDPGVIVPIDDAAVPTDGISALTGFLTPKGETRLILQAAAEGQLELIGARCMNRPEIAMVRFLILPDKVTIPVVVVGEGQAKREIEFLGDQLVMGLDGPVKFSEATTLLSSPLQGECLNYLDVKERNAPQEEAVEIALVYSDFRLVHLGGLLVVARPLYMYEYDRARWAPESPTVKSSPEPAAEPAEDTETAEAESSS